MIRNLSLCTLLFLGPSYGFLPPLAFQSTQDEAQDATPFSPSKELLRALGSLTPAEPVEEFERLPSYPALPTMHLRGLVKMAEREAPAALIEITGLGNLVVHEGEHVTLNLPWQHVSVAGTQSERARPAPARGTGPDAFLREQLPIAVRIESIELTGVTVEIGTLSERMVIR